MRYFDNNKVNIVQEQAVKYSWTIVLRNKAKDYAQLSKPNLNLLVVFSSVIGYLLAPGALFSWEVVLVLFLGGFLVTGSANTINQVLEIKTDALMKRTMGRPLPDGRMTAAEAWVFAGVTGVFGVALLGIYFNWLTGVVSLISLLLYAFAYTPMKKIHPISVLIGAIPGAMPPLIGWVAATGTMSAGGWILFTIQFFWQFPHFWAIAWMGYEDYSKAGIRMLPSGEGRSRFTGLQCMFYSLVLIPISVLPRMFHMTGNIGTIICIILGCLYFAASYIFYKKNDRESARQVMFASIIYLPLVLLALVCDKI